MFIQINSILVKHTFPKIFSLIFIQLIYLIEIIKLINVIFIKLYCEIKSIKHILRENWRCYTVLSYTFTTKFKNYVVEPNILLNTTLYST